MTLIGKESGDRLIARDRVIGEALPRINADKRGSGKSQIFTVETRRRLAEESNY
jgi:hypothetical protein